MVAINPENVQSVLKSAENVLKKKTLGGFSAESTQEALKKVADGVKELADNAVGAVQKELQAYKNKTAQEMADLTSQKDAVILSKDKQIAEIKEEAAQQLKAVKAAKAVKTGKARTLPNGNTETVKVNKNGARMTTETTPEGKKINVTVETIDGDIRKTKYDAQTGKPVQTFTNVNGDKVLNYSDGKLEKAADVNIKKTKPQKPELISDKVIREESTVQTIKKSYSDGSYETFEYVPMYGKVYSGEKFNAQGQKTEYFKKNSFKDKEMTETVKLNPQTGKKSEYYLKSSDGSYTRILYNDAEVGYKKIEKTQQGLKRIITCDIDKYGNVDTYHPKMKYIYPKDSPIKNTKIKLAQNIYESTEEIMKMKDGSTVALKLDGFYNPYHVTIMRKGQEPQVLNRNEGEAFLDKIGKVGYREDRNYYNNIIVNQ